MSTWLALILTLLGVPEAVAEAAPAVPDGARFACLHETYPGTIGALDTASAPAAVVLADGTRLVWDDGRKKTAAERLEDPDVQDTLAEPYPMGPGSTPPRGREDPGRVRHTALMGALWGATEAAVRGELTRVKWMPKHGDGKTLWFNGRHGAAEALAKVSVDLDRLPAKFHKYVTVTAGTFVWRHIAGTERLSAHSHAIAIDINVKYTHYWRWSLKREPDLPWRNRIPLEIVEVFERHGFIWGGKWHHYDTMHFEYRPELLHPRCVEHRE